MKVHIPKVDDDCNFMCGTNSVVANFSSRDACRSCLKKTLEIVDLLAQAHDELASCTTTRRRTALMKKINRALGVITRPSDKQSLVDSVAEKLK